MPATRRGAKLEVAGGPVRALVAKDNRPWQSVYELLTLGDELLVRSYFEYTVQYAMQMTGIPVRRILLAPSAPEITVLRADKPSAVVWTGRRPAADAIIALMGLEEFRGDVAYVADVPLPNVRARSFRVRMRSWPKSWGERHVSCASIRPTRQTRLRSPGGGHRSSRR